jgi:hypothetical protein
MNGGKKKTFTKGDQVHFIVTEDFVKTVNEFVAYCRDNSINTSAAMRMAITEWLRFRTERERKFEQLVQGTTSLKKIADDYERNVLREV